MTEPSRKAYEEWKEADAAARVAEQDLALAWEHYFSRKDHAPSHALILEVSRRRAVANDRLSRAMSALASSAGTRPGDFTHSGSHPGLGKEKGPRFTEAE
ncbi:MAG TPA: hypothetical protein VMZ74_04155 [Ramlibacter sp.]|nr:hypothetical protein [Ramlibacter sp.]